MDFETGGKNPFLMDDADYGAPAAAAASSNPFLSNSEYEAPALSENPFFSAMGGDAELGAATYMATNGASTNPFAAFAVDPEPAADEQTMNFYAQVETANAYSAQPVPETDFFGTAPAPTDTRNLPSSLDLKDGAVPRLATEVETESDYCMETTEIFGVAPAGPPSQPSSGRSTPRGGPRRPPPPRPVPPSQETKNLILSVTGAMEATSSHLLDRLPPTRTPSPTLLRDLQSPSPTPDAPFSDFLGVGGGAAPDTSGSAQEVNLLGDLDDIPSSTIVPPLMEPIPPSTIAPPLMEPMPLTAISQDTPKKPPPPRPGPPPVVSKAAEIMNLFDSSATTTTTASMPNTTDIFGGEVDILGGEPVMEAPAQDAVLFGATDVSTNETTSDIFAKPSPPMVTPIAPAGPPPRPPPPPIIAATASPVVSPPSQGLESEPPSVPEPAPPEPSIPDIEPEPLKAPSIGTTPIQSHAPEPFAAPAEADVSGFGDGPDLFGAEQIPQSVPAPKNTNDIMNLFGADTAAVNALNSAPAQAADDFFGGGAGFDEAPKPAVSVAEPFGSSEVPSGDSEFDAFAAKFENAGGPGIMADPFDPFAGGSGAASKGAFDSGGDVWGSGGGTSDGGGFGAEDSFDAFLSMSAPPVPQSTPARVSRAGSADSDEGPDFSVVIKPQSEFGAASSGASDGFVPTLAPPPKVEQTAFVDSTPRFNPFDKSGELSLAVQQEQARPVLGTPPGVDFKRTDSQETPPTPLFDDDVSYPLEDFPRIHYDGPGWEMQLRQPNRKKITGQRFWKKIFIRLVYQGENPILQLLNTKDDKDPFQELPLQACYCVSDICAQQYDQYGKIFTVKLQYVFYKERPGVRPGQVTKAERITNKLSQFAAYAIQGDYQGCKEFASDLKKLGMPVEHAPQISQLFKIGSQTYEDMKQFSVIVEEALFKLSAHRDRALNYKQEEVQITAVDELYVEQDLSGHVTRQIARVRLFFLGFLSGMPDVELGVNDMWRQGKEVVGRHDIIPVVTEEWIRLEGVEFHSCVQLDEYEKTKTIKFKPPDACYIELMRFRVRPPRNRELPLQLKAVMCVTGNKVELRADILVPGFSSRKYGQIPCEDVSVRFPIPECWIYLFRVEKHFRYGSVKSAHRRAGKVKGIERFLGALETMDQSLMEVTSGQAKYEHQHRSIVWRMPRLPKEGQGAYTTHTLVCRMNLTSYDQVPSELAQYAYVEFTMPQTQVSHTTVRSVSIQPQPDDPPEKYVRQLSRHEYRVEIEHTQGEGPGAYIAATITKPVAPPEPVPEERPAAADDSDSDSD